MSLPTRRSVVALLVAAPVAARARAARGAEPTAEELAKKVQARHDAAKTYQASFEQTFTLKAQGTEKVQKGKVAFERPGKMSFRYDAGDRVVSDGKTVRVYEKQHAHVYEVALKKSVYPASIAFLVGKGQLEKDFAWVLRDAKKAGFEGGAVIEGTPREATPAWQRLFLWVEPKTGDVRRVLVLDAQGNRNRFDFTGASLDKAVPKGEFEFTPPPGTKVVKV